MDRPELIRVVTEIAEDQRKHYGGQSWKPEEQEALIRDIERLDLNCDEDDLWSAHHNRLNHGGEFPPKITTTLADIKFAMKSLRSRMRQSQRIAAGFLPKPSTPDSRVELQKYLDGLGVASLAEAVAVETEALKHGLWRKAASSPTGNYSQYKEVMTG